MNKAKYVNQISVIDPDTKGEVELAVYKHINSGGMFAIDSSFIDQIFDEDEKVIISDPFNKGRKLELIED